MKQYLIIYLAKRQEKILEANTKGHMVVNKTQLSKYPEGAVYVNNQRPDEDKTQNLCFTGRSPKGK